MADLVRFAILHGFKSQGGFAVDLKRPNRWCKDPVLMISSPSARARPCGGWLRGGSVPVAGRPDFLRLNVIDFAIMTYNVKASRGEGRTSASALTRATKVPSN